MKKSLQLLLIGLLLLTLPIEAAVKDYKTATIKEHFMVESYGGDNEGLESLIAYYYDYFLNEEIFLATGISWAVEGNHGGYGTAQLGLGMLKPITQDLSWEIKGFIGAGGHILIDAGGGALIAGQLGLNYRMWDPVLLELRYGLLSYPGGDYSVSTWSLGIATQYDLILGRK